MKNIHLLTRRGIAAAGVAFALFTLTACMQPDSGGGTENAGVQLTGRVVGTNSSPISGVVVTTARTGLSDTTDALGRYVLSGDATSGNGVVLDTLRYSKNGQSLARVSVLAWIDTLPDVEVIQRDISGLLNTQGLTATRIEAVLKGDGIDSTDPVTADFYYNDLTGNYSGFLYFPPASSTMNYNVQIKVYGADDLLIGNSQVVPFNSFAGNITMPAFSAGNAQPVAKAGIDTAVALGATINLRGTAVDSFGGAITKWEWSIGGGSFVETSTGDTSFSRAAHGAYPCILRVTDNDGNKVVDTVIVSSVSHGTSWTTRTSGTTSALTAVVWTGTQFVAVGAGGIVLRSPDGISWTSSNVTLGQTNAFADLAWTGQKLIATTPGGSTGAPLFYSSADGIIWGAMELPWIIRGAGDELQVSTSDSTVLISSRNSQFVARSEDHGATWLVDTLPPNTHEWDGPTYGLNAYTKHAGRTVGAGSNGRTISSTGNGIWTRHTNSGSFTRPRGGVYDYTMTSIVSSGTHAVAVGYAGHVMRSTDGTTWATPRIAGGVPPEQEGGSSSGDLYGLTWTGNTLVAVGNGYTLISADGGENWAPGQLNTGFMRSIAWNGTRLVAVGNSGKIVTSP